MVPDSLVTPMAMPIRATKGRLQLRATTPVFRKLRLQRPSSLLANVERTGASESTPSDGLAAGWPCLQGEKQLQTLSLGSGTRNDACLLPLRRPALGAPCGQSDDPMRGITQTRSAVGLLQNSSKSPSPTSAMTSQKSCQCCSENSI